MYPEYIVLTFTTSICLYKKEDNNYRYKCIIDTGVNTINLKGFSSDYLHLTNSRYNIKLYNSTAEVLTEYPEFII